MSDTKLIERLRNHYRLDIVDFDVYLEAADLIEQQAARIAELEALLCAPPVAWIRPDHLKQAQKAPFLCRVEPSVRCDLVPIFRAPVADSAMAKDAERYRWLKMQSPPYPQRQLMLSTPWGQWDAAIDAALAASEPKTTGE